MSQIQECYVCGKRGLLVESHIQVGLSEAEMTGPLMIGHCPRCQRFICSRHGEKLDPAKLRGSWLTKFFRRSSVRVVCCPFDPGVPLGVADDTRPSPLAALFPTGIPESGIETDAMPGSS